MYFVAFLRAFSANLLRPLTVTSYGRRFCPAVSRDETTYLRRRRRAIISLFYKATFGLANSSNKDANVSTYGDEGERKYFILRRSGGVLF